MILVTGAGGKTGWAVIKRLAAGGQQVRALVRRMEQVELLGSLGAIDFVVGDMSANDTMDQAFAGVRAVYHICPNMHPNELTIGESAIRAAQAAGVERFVYHSVLHPQIELMAHHWQKMRVEEKLFSQDYLLRFCSRRPICRMCWRIGRGHCQGRDLCGAIRVGYTVEHG